MCKNEMTGNTILYVSDPAASNKLLVEALKSAGYDVVSTSSASQAVALLFLMYSAAGVVLSHDVTEHASFDVVHSLRMLCPQIPIIILCDGQTEPVPSGELCVGARETLEKLVDTVQRLLSGSQHMPERCRGEVRAA
jgi:DNA-binding NtrC family response regulator